MIQVTACDKGREVPALTYEIKVSDGREISTDRCSRHASKIEALIKELLEEAEEQAGEEPVPASEPEPQPVKPASPVVAAAKKAPAKKAPAKKAPAKKATTTEAATKKATSGRRRPKVVTLDEIEAQKRQG
ncbi:hypothetical protein ABZ330_16455 [Streptomyces sp. NPDC006172]|uniref:hypothetical protein n=1 Tax=Streptomyces sp. NPDC006172 TaxID=3154470 RepID=UPI00340D5AA4